MSLLAIPRCRPWFHYCGNHRALLMPIINVLLQLQSVYHNVFWFFWQPQSLAEMSQKFSLRDSMRQSQDITASEEVTFRNEKLRITAKIFFSLLVIALLLLMFKCQRQLTNHSLVTVQSPANSLLVSLFLSVGRFFPWRTRCRGLRVSWPFCIWGWSSSPSFTSASVPSGICALESTSEGASLSTCQTAGKTTPTFTGLHTHVGTSSGAGKCLIGRVWRWKARCSVPVNSFHYPVIALTMV